jgi:DnaD/phage-associated family protein
MTEERASYVVSFHEPDDQRNHPLLRLLDRPIAFHRVLVDIAGGILPALMLSQALYWTRRTKNKAGWFYKSAVEWEEEIGLTPQEQRTARKKLSEHGWWEEDLRKANGAPTTHYRINVFQLMAAALNSDLLDATNGYVASNETMDLLDATKPINIDYTETTTTPTGVGAVFKMWQQNMPGTLSPVLVDQIADLVAETSIESVIEGIKIAVQNGKRNLGYVRGCAVRHASGEGAPVSSAEEKYTPQTRKIINPITGEIEDIVA